MKLVVVFLLSSMWMTSAWAKTLKIPRGDIEVNQLHDELLARFSKWRGTQQPDGTFINPLLRIEHNDKEITLTVPDDADEAAIQAAVASHVPRPRADKTVAPDDQDSAIMGLEERVKQLEALLDLE